jgi:hypothetical protein
MLSSGHYRFANDMGEVRSNRVIPIHSHQAQCGAGNETSAYTKESTQNSNDKADSGQINWVDVRVGDWKKHELFPASTQEAKQERRHRIQNNGLTGDEQNCDRRIHVTMLRLEPIQPIAKQMKNQKEIADDEN